MEDLSYIIGLGFSGADISRALIISFFMAMLFANQNSIWKLGFGALAIDKLVWPLIGQAAAGAGFDAVIGSVQGIIASLGDDLGVYMVRYFGLTVLICLFAAGRSHLHALAPAKAAA